MQCRGHRGNGESFLAEVWFSSYKEGSTPKLAAIIADVSEEQATSMVRVAILMQETTLAQRAGVGGSPARCSGLGEQGNSTNGLSESAVKNTLQQLFGKTQVRTRSQLVRVALERYRDQLSVSSARLRSRIMDMCNKPRLPHIATVTNPFASLRRKCWRLSIHPRWKDRAARRRLLREVDSHRIQSTPY